MWAEKLRHFEQVLADALQRLTQISETQSEERAAPGKWSRKEILGHLIDSASNNHQRFVRTQLASEVSFPGYAHPMGRNAGIPVGILGESHPALGRF